METEAEIGVMWPRAREYPGPPEDGRGKGGFSPKAFRVNVTLLPSRLQNRERINFHGAKPLHLWLFVPPASRKFLSYRISTTNDSCSRNMPISPIWSNLLIF